MGMNYRILDYQNGRIMSNISSVGEVCILLKLLSTYSNSWAVTTHNDKFITSSFIQKDNEWKYEPPPMQA